MLYYITALSPKSDIKLRLLRIVTPIKFSVRINSEVSHMKTIVSTLTKEQKEEMKKAFNFTERFIYMVKKTVKRNKQCRSCCMCCKYYEECRNDG